MESVYLETTFVSYLVARPSRDLLVAAHQQLSQDWWVQRRAEFDCCISQIVLDEASMGDPQEAEKRMRVINDLSALEVTAEAESLAQEFLSSSVMPPQAIRDAAHLAVATVHNINYLLTWNCKHLANAQMIRRLSDVCDRMGRRIPVPRANPTATRADSPRGRAQRGSGCLFHCPVHSSCR